ncbi:putative adhesin [Rickettsiella endosymbiont of Dermanyssus gallinae]|uniref:putative adhesin n=1 Tax=Rickettsiella endosymbiont of Dermanyssus gallinae TaxID=2856608 RepID=UPI001C52A7E6|nr:hypothetical protein [Rickettsiella endosymbiont of Dermanyssus gallinae]
MPYINNNTNFTPVAGRSAFFSVNDRVPEAEDFEVSHQALASSGDEVDKGNFKGLYPEVERSEATGETYRPILRDYALENNRTIKLDLIAVHVGKEKNGEQQGAFLLRGPINVAGQKPVEQVVVSSHGSISSRRGGDDIELDEKMPIISFLGPHEKVLKAGIQSVVPYAEVSYKGITLTSHQAKNDFETLGYQVITGTSKFGAIHSYDLQKFDDEPLLHDSKHILENISAFMQIQRECAAIFSELGMAYESDASKLKPEGKFLPLFDTIVIRGRGPKLSARDAIKIAQEHGYKKVICNFCRCKNGTFSFPKTHEADSTKLLENPIFYSWDEIKKLEQNKVDALKLQAELSPRPSIFRWR